MCLHYFVESFGFGNKSLWNNKKSGTFNGIMRDNLMDDCSFSNYFMKLMRERLNDDVRYTFGVSYMDLIRQYGDEVNNSKYNNNNIELCVKYGLDNIFSHLFGRTGRFDSTASYDIPVVIDGMYDGHRKGSVSRYNKSVIWFDAYSNNRNKRVAKSGMLHYTTIGINEFEEDLADKIVLCRGSYVLSKCAIIPINVEGRQAYETVNRDSGIWRTEFVSGNSAKYSSNIDDMIDDYNAIKESLEDNSVVVDNTTFEPKEDININEHDERSGDEVSVDESVVLKDILETMHTKKPVKVKPKKSVVIRKEVDYEGDEEFVEDIVDNLPNIRDYIESVKINMLRGDVDKLERYDFKGKYIVLGSKVSNKLGKNICGMDSLITLTNDLGLDYTVVEDVCKMLRSGNNYDLTADEMQYVCDKLDIDMIVISEAKMDIIKGKKARKSLLNSEAYTIQEFKSNGSKGSIMLYHDGGHYQPIVKSNSDIARRKHGRVLKNRVILDYAIIPVLDTAIFETNHIKYLTNSDIKLGPIYTKYSEEHGSKYIDYINKEREKLNPGKVVNIKQSDAERMAAFKKEMEWYNYLQSAKGQQREKGDLTGTTRIV